MIEPIIGLYKADISDHKAKIKELSGEQKKLAEEQLKHLEKQNAALDGYIKTIGKVTIAVGAVAVAGKALWEGWEHNVRKAQLANNVLASDVERLRRGFGGLRTGMQALEVANKLSHGAFRLTGTQMESVGRAMRQLVREGQSWEEVTKKVTDAVVKLEGDALKDFGIRVQEAKTDTEKFAAIIGALTQKSAALGDETKTSAESMVAIKTRFAEAADSIKESLGKVAVALEPLLRGVARLAELSGGMLGQIADGWSDLVNLGFAAFQGKGSDADKRLFEKYGLKRDKTTGTLYYADARDMYLDRGEAGNFIAGSIARDLAAGVTVGPDIATASSVTPAEWERLKKLGEEQARRRKEVAQRYKPEMPGYVLGETVYGEGDFFTGGGQVPTDSTAYTQITSQMLAHASIFQADAAEQAAEQARIAAGKTFLERTFGPIDDFELYRRAFETLQGATTSAFAAWIDGSMGAGEAVKKFMADSLKGTATWLLAESIKYGLMAISSAIPGPFFSPGSAAAYGATAAKYAAGAALIGGLAKALHSGGGGGGGGGYAGAAPTGGGASSGANAGGNTYVVTYNDAFADDSPLIKHRNAKKMIETVMGSPGVH